MSGVSKMELNETFTISDIANYNLHSDEFVENLIKRENIWIEVTPKMKSLLTTWNGLRKLNSTMKWDSKELISIEDTIFHQLSDEILENVRINP